MDPLTEAAPAKINLFLAITGRRPDGFHDLVSVAAPIGIEDSLTGVRAEVSTLTTDEASLPAGEDNLVLKAARLYREAGGKTGAAFHLRKRIPMGAGLGGGSSDAVAALRLLERLSPEPLGAARLRPLAEALGSDCPLFLEGRPLVMRGRGERIEPLPAEARARLSGRRLLVFKPGFGISTPWAYRRLAEAADYVPAAEAEARLAAWLGDPSQPAEALLFNSMERAAFPKYPAFETAMAKLGHAYALAPRMSGSGSACFAFLGEGQDAAAIAGSIRRDWGPSAFIAETRIL